MKQGNKNQYQIKLKLPRNKIKFTVCVSQSMDAT